MKLCITTTNHFSYQKYITSTDAIINAFMLISILGLFTIVSSSVGWSVASFVSSFATIFTFGILSLRVVYGFFVYKMVLSKATGYIESRLDHVIGYRTYLEKQLSLGLKTQEDIDVLLEEVRDVVVDMKRALELLNSISLRKAKKLSADDRLNIESELLSILEEQGKLYRSKFIVTV